jgi:hypothetical protein
LEYALIVPANFANKKRAPRDSAGPFFYFYFAWQTAFSEMQEFPHGLPFLQTFVFSAEAAAAGAASVVAAGAAMAAAGAAAGATLAAAAASAVAAGAASAVPVGLWQTSSLAMQAFPHGLPFLQFFAKAVVVIPRESARTRVVKIVEIFMVVSLVGLNSFQNGYSAGVPSGMKVLNP